MCFNLNRHYRTDTNRLATGTGTKRRASVIAVWNLILICADLHQALLGGRGGFSRKIIVTRNTRQQNKIEAQYETGYFHWGEDNINGLMEKIKRSILRLSMNELKGYFTNETNGAVIFEYHDKMPLKIGYKEKGVCEMPDAVVRHGPYISKGVIMMPSYVNIGPYLEKGSMLDTWSPLAAVLRSVKTFTSQAV